MAKTSQQDVIAGGGFKTTTIFLFLFQCLLDRGGLAYFSFPVCVLDTLFICVLMWVCS
ncbi:putative membrane protein [Chlamydia psittaci 02DC15]|nr:putative membrane protein [Chlamydia psittaci 02DC15]